MRFYILIFFLYLYHFVEPASYGCIIWENSYLYYKNETFQNQTEYFNINFYKTPRKGEFGIGFSTSPSPQDMFYLVYFSSNALYFYSNHSLLNQTFNETYFLDTSLYYAIDNIYYANFMITRQKFESAKYIFFTEMENTTHLNFGLKTSPVYDETSNSNENWCTPNYLGLPGRLFATWWFTYLLYILFSIILIIFCVNYREYQPLKSRGGVGPIVCVMSSIINITGDFIQTYFFNYEQYCSSNCFVSIYILYPSIIMMIPVTLFYYLKFIILVNVNAKKFKLVTSKSNEFLSIFYKILLKLSAIESIVIFTIFLFIIYYSLCLLFYGIFGFNCASIAYDISRYLYLVISLPLFFIIIILSIGDLIQNYRLIIQCKLREFYLVTDPFYFRLIFLISPLEIIIIIIWASPLNYTATFRNTLVELGFAIAIANNSFLPLVFTMISYHFKKKSHSSCIIEGFFRTDEIYLMFLNFSKNEWSMENVVCQKLIYEYKASKIGRKKIINDINHKFLKGEEFELNIREERKKLLIHEIDQIQNDNYPNELFNELEKDLQINLSDILVRYMVTEEYKGYISKQSTIIQLTDKTTN